MKKRTLMIIVIVVLFIAGGFFVIWKILDQAIDNIFGDILINHFVEMTSTGDDFLVAFQDHDYKKAYSLCTNEYQQKLGSKLGLEEMLPPTSQIVGWEYEIHDFVDSNQNASVSLIGFMFFKDGSSSGFLVNVGYEEDVPKVSKFVIDAALNDGE
jgi:hypothetical protein